MASGIPSSRRQIDTTSGTALLVHAQAGALRPGPVDEQRDRIGGPGRRRIGLAGSGQRQRRHPVDGLPADAQRLAAGGQQVHPRAPPQDRLRGLGAGADQVLAVVQHDQDVLGGQGVEQGVQGGPARLPGDPQRLRNGRRHGVLVGDRGQLHQPHPVPGPVQQLGGHLQAQPGLAAPPGPGQRDQARGSHQGPDLGQLPVPADEPRQLGREIVRQRRVAQRAQRREPGPQARRLQLEDPFRAAQVLQPVHAQIGQRRAGRKPVAHQGSRRLRQQHLAPVPDRGHPGGAMHIQAHQARGRPGRLTGMHPHPHPDLLPGRPRVRLQGLLHLQHRRHARPRRGEHREERISLGIDFPAAVGGQHRPDERVVVGQHLRVDVLPQPPQQRRRALDVGKQKRESLRASHRSTRRRRRPKPWPSLLRHGPHRPSRAPARSLIRRGQQARQQAYSPPPARPVTSGTPPAAPTAGARPQTVRQSAAVRDRHAVSPARSTKHATQTARLCPELDDPGVITKPTAPPRRTLIFGREGRLRYRTVITLCHSRWLRLPREIRRSGARLSRSARPAVPHPSDCYGRFPLASLMSRLKFERR